MVYRTRKIFGLRLCVSSNYKIIIGKDIIFHIGILCWRGGRIQTLQFNLQLQECVKFKLQDHKWEEHFLTIWNFMLKTEFTRSTRKNEEKLCLIEIDWCLGLLKEIIWLNGNYQSNFVSIAWSWFIAPEWKMTWHRFMMLLTKFHPSPY